MHTLLVGVQIAAAATENFWQFLQKAEKQKTPKVMPGLNNSIPRYTQEN